MSTDPPAEHKVQAPRTLAFAVVTVSDSRDLSRDASGDAIVRLLEDAGHKLARRALVRDEPLELRAALETALAGEPDVVVFTGGTGVAPRDVTIETLAPRFEKRLAGFGEIFRMLSYQEVGSAAMLSRADAGTIGRSVVFLLPGSPKACRLALEKLILPEAGHLAGLLRR